MLVELEDGTNRNIRTKDFNPYFPHADPKSTTTASFDFSPDTTFSVQQYHQANVPTIEPEDGTALADRFADAHAASLHRTGNIPLVITANTYPPKTKAEAKTYPDADKWMASIDS